MPTAQQIIDQMREDLGRVLTLQDSLAQLETVINTPPDEPPPPPPTGTTIRVRAGGDVQKAIDEAQPGQTIALDPAGSWLTAVLKPKSGGGPIRITTENAGGSGRVTAADADGFARFGGQTGPGLTTEPKAGNYILDHLRFVPAASAPIELMKLSLGDETDVLDLSHDITLDRIYMEGHPTRGQKRGIAANCVNFTIKRSMLVGFVAPTSVTTDAQAIAIWNAPGPFLIEDCYLEGSGENILVGGSDPKIVNLVPSDGVIRQCYMFKPPEWKTVFPGSVKNLLEFKNAQRWTVEQCRFENVWTAGQAGRAILFTVRNQGGNAPWSTVQDVVFRRNHVLGVEQDAFLILAIDDTTGRASVRARNIQLIGNVIQAKSGILFNRGLDGFVCDHNLFLLETWGRFMSFNPTGQIFNGFVCRNTIAASGQYGIHSADAGLGKSALDKYCPGYVWEKMIMEKANQRNITYPPDTRIVPFGTLPSGVDATTFQPTVDLLRMDGTDGQPVGAPDLSQEVA